MTMIWFFYVFFREEELDWVIAMGFIEDFFFFSNDFLFLFLVIFSWVLGFSNVFQCPEGNSAGNIGTLRALFQSKTQLMKEWSSTKWNFHSFPHPNSAVTLRVWPICGLQIFQQKDCRGSSSFLWAVCFFFTPDCPGFLFYPPQGSNFPNSRAERSVLSPLHSAV